MKKTDLAKYLMFAELAAQDPERANELAKEIEHETKYNGDKKILSSRPKTAKTKRNRAKNKSALKARKRNRKR